MIFCVELIEEVPVGYKGALIDESTTVDVIGIKLEYTMPVLQHRKSVLLQLNVEGRRNPYDGGHQVHGIVGQGVIDVELKSGTLMSVGSRKMAKKKCPEWFTLVPVISGPGNIPSTRLALQRESRSVSTQRARLQVTYERLYPSGAMSRLTIVRSATGPTAA